MFDDFQAVTNYGKLSAKFHLGKLRLMGFMSLF